MLKLDYVSSEESGDEAGMRNVRTLVRESKKLKKYKQELDKASVESSFESCLRALYNVQRPTVLLSSRTTPTNAPTWASTDENEFCGLILS